MVKCVWFIKIYSNLFLLQIKNEELCRIQNELEQECDQFRKLKKMIQEHGLPNHEQLIVLQQQVRVKSFFKDGISPMQKVHWGSSSFLTSFIQVKSRNVGKMIPLVISFFLALNECLPVISTRAPGDLYYFERFMETIT